MDILNFDQVQYTSVFAFMLAALCVLLKGPLLTERPHIYSLVYSFGSFMVLNFTFCHITIPG